MKDRIILLIKAKNLTAAQFADEIGVQKSSISHIISGRNNASLDFVQKVLTTYPDVNMEWLMFGKGPLFKTFETGINVSNDEQLNEVSSRVLPPVDLFSDIQPGKHQDYRKENELSSEVKLTNTILQGDTGNITANPQAEEKINKISAPKNEPAYKALNSGHYNTDTKTILKIVEFYNDNTYREYFPE